MPSESELRRITVCCYLMLFPIFKNAQPEDCFVFGPTHPSICSGSASLLPRRWYVPIHAPTPGPRHSSPPSPPPQPPGSRAQHIEGQPRPDIGSSLIYSPRANLNILSNSKSPSRPSATHCLGADLFVALYQHNPAATGARHSLLETPLGIIDKSMVYCHYCHPSPAVTNPGGGIYFNDAVNGSK